MDTRIHLAGRIATAVGDHHTDERVLPGAQARLALCLLVCRRHRPVSRDELAETLWPGGRPPTWEAALRGVVSRVRRFLTDAGLGGVGVLRSVDGALHLSLPDDVEVDLERAEGDLRRAEACMAGGDAATAATAAAAARAVLVRPLLPGVPAPWLDDTRAELARRLVGAVQTLAAARLELGEHDNAATAAAEVVSLDPYRESAHRLLMQAHSGAGNPAAGLAAYERCRRLLAEDLGLDPAPQTRELYLALLRSGAPPADPEPDTPTPPECPYRGLRTFDEGDARFFFGREPDVARLLDRLAGRRFLAVLGPSGSGKSSLVRAGLMPALRRGALPGSDTWRVQVLRPGPEPVRALARALGGIDPDDDEPALHRAVAAAARGEPPRLLVVDQLEEVFTVCADPERRRLFLDLLVAVVAAHQGLVTVVVTLRADLYPELAAHPQVADLVSARQFLVTPLDEVGLSAAVEGPARAVGLGLEEGLTESVLRDVARRPGALPLLGHCLLELWEHRTEAILTLAAYRRVGGAHGALAQRAEAVHQGLRPGEQPAARHVLLRLVAPGPHADDVRRRVPIAELATEHHRMADVETVVGRLAEARLLTTGGPPDTERWVELSHEALVRGWPRLRRWVDEDRAGLRVHRRLTAAATEWDRLDRDPGALYRGAPLAEAAAWAQAHPDAPNPLERAFLRAAGQAERADLRRGERRLRLVAVALTVGLLAIAALAATAVTERDRAQRQQLLAESRQLAGEAVAALGIDPAQGLDLAVRAVRTEPTDEALAALRRAVVTPQPRLDVPGGRGDLAVDPEAGLLAVGDGDGALRLWDRASGEPGPDLAGHDGAVSSVTFGSGGLLVSTGEGGIRVWDTGDGTLHRELPHDREVFRPALHPGAGLLATVGSLEPTVAVHDLASGEQVTSVAAPAPVSFLQFTPDAAALLAWSAIDPDLFLLDVAGGEPRARLVGHDGPALDARITPDGQHAVSVGLDGTARIWELGAGTQVGVVDGLADAVWTLELDPAGELALVGDNAGATRVVEIPDGTTRFELPGHRDAVVDAAFSPDGEVIATAGQDGTVRVHDLATGRLRGVLTLDGAPRLDIGRRSVEFSADGATLVTRASTVQVWDTPPGPRAVLTGHDGPVRALAVAPDGTALAAGSGGGVRLWELPAGGAGPVLGAPDSQVTGVSFSHDGALLAVANPFTATLAELDLRK